MNITEAKRYVNALAAPRQKREYMWRELSRWLIGHRGVFGGYDPNTEYQKLILFRECAANACLKAASGMTSGMTPRNVSWFKPVFTEEELLEASGARNWLDQLDHLMKDCLAHGGFYQAIQAFNLDLVWAGCALLYCERGENSILRFECCQVGTFQIARDHERRLSAVSRELVLSPSSMAELFGEEKLAETTRSKLRTTPHEETRVTQLVVREKGGGFPVKSYYYEEGGKDFLKSSGFYEMPFFFTCWHDAINPYGSGPGDAALPDARQLDKLERRKLAAMGKLVDPPVLIDDPNLKDELNLGPGQINYMPNGRQIIPVFDLSATAQSLPQIQAEIQTVQKRLHDSLMATIFETMPLDQRPRDMSATEYLERKREAMQLLGPVISAYEPDVLTPVLERVLQSLARIGQIPVIPRALENQPLLMKMDFFSPMANALRQTGAETTRSILQDALSIAQSAQNPEILDKIDFDQSIDELATGLGAPGSIIRSDEDVAKMREARASQQAQAARLQEAQAQMGLAQQMQQIAANQKIIGE